jgi:hypothetical protein
MIEVNCETGETTERPLTAEEIAQRETDAAEYATRRAQIEAEEKTKADAKVSALAKLAALGLTEDEAKAIAG